MFKKLLKTRLVLVLNRCIAPWNHEAPFFLSVVENSPLDREIYCRYGGWVYFFYSHPLLPLIQIVVFRGSDLALDKWLDWIYRDVWRNHFWRKIEILHSLTAESFRYLFKSIQYKSALWIFIFLSLYLILHRMQSIKKSFKLSAWVNIIAAVSGLHSRARISNNFI